MELGTHTYLYGDNKTDGHKVVVENDKLSR